MRRFVARLLRRLADRLHPQETLRVRLVADANQFNEAIRNTAAKLRRLNEATRRQHYAGHVAPNITPSESGVAVTFTDSLPRRDA